MAKKTKNKYATPSGLRFLENVNPQAAMNLKDKIDSKKGKSDGKKSK